MTKSVSIFLSIILFFTGCYLKTPKKIPVKVLVINFFEVGADTGDVAGERQLWVEGEDLNQSIDFKQGIAPLRYNPKTEVLNLLTGEGTLNSTVSMMGLGMDSRFDLTHAYIILAGIAGGDPQDTSLGSAVWARFVIDADLKHSIDVREMPKDWKFGTFPYLGQKPNEKPVKHLGSEFFQINEQLLQWAYKLTSNVMIPDEKGIKEKRSLYKGYPNAQLAPRVMIGDNLDGQDFWHGKLTNDWANEWVSYLTQGKGNFVTTAMEDTGVLNAIKRLSGLHLVDPNRVLVLRTISNYSMQWPGVSAYQSFLSESSNYSGFNTSIKAAYIVGSKVVHNLVQNFNQYKNNLPK